MPVRLGAAFHIFTAVLLIGTLWRILAYHLMASQNGTAQHVGAGMIIQY
jgi:uncharacterized membrane protein